MAVGSDIHTLRGSTHYSEQRDGYENPILGQTKVIMARVVGINYSTRTVNCVGLGNYIGNTWDNVWVSSISASQSEGSTWLPDIYFPKTEKEKQQPALSNIKDVLAFLVFIEGNPSLPLCIGFHFPNENEMLFEEPGLKIERHSSNVYERLTKSGNYEFVFPDKTFIKIAAETEPDLYTNLDKKNFHAKTRPWSIKKDFDRKIILGHSTGNRLRVFSGGVYIETYSNSGASIGKRTGGYAFSEDGNLLLTGKELFISNTQTNIDGPVVAGAINATSLSLSGTDINSIINTISESKANSVVSQYFGGSGGGSSGGGSGGSFTLSPGSIADGSITAAKLSFDPATQAELDTHTTDSSIHFTIGTTATTAAAGNHTHSIFNNGTVTWGYATDMLKITSTTNNAGSGTIASAARIDHAHGIDIAALSAAPLSITPGATNGVGSSLVAFARADHVHGAPTTWTPSSHTHAYTDLLPISNSFAFTANTISLYNTNATNSFTLNPNGSVVLAATTLDLVGVVKINGVTITGSSSSGGGSSSSGSSSSSSYSSYFLKNTTIGAVTKNLTMDGSDFYSSVNQIKLAANSSFGFRADISAATSTGNAGALWVVEGVVRRSSDISSITLQDVRLVNSYVDPSLSSCSVSVDVDAAIFGSLIFYAEGASSLTIYWTADVTMFGDPALLPVAPNAGGGSGSSSGSSSSITFPAPGGSLPSVNDDADYGVYVLKGYSTSASSVRLTTDGLVSTISNVPILSDNTSWVTDITVAAHVAGTSAGVWKYSGLFRRGASASSTTFLGPLTQEEIMDANFESAVVSILPDTTFGGINISVTGLAGISSNWIAVIHATELR